MNCLWTEKYRPKTQNDLQVPEHIKRFLENANKNGFPHLLLYGPPGTGKTTFAMLLKPTLILNASDDRGIDIIRNKVKKVANTAARQIILLDECENLTKDAQTCLRRILEDFHNTTFIFSTNYINKIIAPLKSRLLKIKFLARDSTALEKIGNTENMERNKIFYNDLLKKCDGDLRRSINVLQGINPLNNPNVDEMIGRIPEDVVKGFWEAKDPYEFAREFVFESYSTLQLIKQLSESLRGSDFQKAKFSKSLSELEAMSVKGCSDELIVITLCMKKIKIF